MFLRHFRYPLVLVVAVLGATAALPLLWAEPPQGKRYALLVGVKDYDHSKFKSLDYPENDVTDLGELLGKAGYEVKLLTGTTGKDQSALRPTRTNVLAQLKTTLDKCKRHDTVLVALAGHGLQFDQQKDSYFCPSDANPTKPGSLVSLGDLYRQLDDSGAGVKLVLVDACRDDPMQGRGRGIDGDNAPRPPRGVAVFFSCSAGQRAFEHDQLKHGVFFHYLLEGLRGAAKNEDNEVDWNMLTGFVSKKVSREVPKLIGNGARQSPNVVADLSGEPPVLLSLRGGSPKLGHVELKKDNSYINNSLSMELALVPAGAFLMGSPSKEAERYENEELHQVEITRSFYLGKCEVTAGQFRAFVEATGYRTEAEKDIKGGWGYEQASGQFGQKRGYSWKNPGFKQSEDHPVVNVGFHDALAFCAWLSKLEGHTYRLPTEAEWEYSCRAKTTTRFHCGDDEGGLQRVANIADVSFKGLLPSSVWAMKWDDGQPFTAPVARLQANAFGLNDMHGNVWEWCSDWYDTNYHLGSTPRDPQGPPTGKLRIIRGGSFSYAPRLCRSAFRGRVPPDARNCDLGFRVVRAR